MSHFPHILFFSSCSLQTDSEIPPIINYAMLLFPRECKKGNEPLALLSWKVDGS